MGRRRSLTHFPESCLWSEAKRNHPLCSGDCAALPSGKKFTEADPSAGSLSLPPVPSARSLLPAGPDFGAPLGPSTGASTHSSLGQGWCGEMRSGEQHGGDVCRAAGRQLSCWHEEYQAPEGQGCEHCRSADERRTAPGPVPESAHGAWRHSCRSWDAQPLLRTACPETKAVPRPLLTGQLAAVLASILSKSWRAWS